MRELIPLLESTWLESLQSSTQRAEHQTPEILRITTPHRHAMLNRVHSARVAPQRAEALIAETVSHFRAREVPFTWFVTPSCQPPDLAQRLLSAGLLPGEIILGLAAQVEEALEELGPPPADVRPVTAVNFADWQAVAHSAGLPVAPLELAWEAWQRSGAAGYVAYAGGRPAAIGRIRLLENSVYLGGAMTAPGYRGRGLFRSLVSARLQAGRDAGCTYALVHSAPTSAPIFLRCGFRVLCRLESFVWDPWNTGTGAQQA